MGILNATPDSFSGDGLRGLDTLRYSTGEERGLRGLDTLRYSTGEERGPEGLDTLRYSTGGSSTGGSSTGGDDPTGEEGWIDAAIEQGRRMVAAGAHILDVGGESTRPGALPVDADEELRRVIPLIQGLAAAVDVPISIDTSKAAVAAAALAAGASLVNDVWGLRLDPAIAQVAAQQGAPVILMHNRSRRQQVSIDPALGGHYVGTDYNELLGDIAAELQVSIDLARGAGIPDSHILLDPGIGFGKTVAQNLALLDRLGELRSLGFPLLVGPSRKSFIGYTLDLPPEQRIEGTAAAVAIAIARGADVVRVHDVQPMARVARMADAIVRRET
ncbi:MAG: dihydropteroate synthase [Anaerolinea sp.]|nr:dihydropteroate synthase [Anaerolinea sp.]